MEIINSPGSNVKMYISVYPHFYPSFVEICKQFNLNIDITDQNQNGFIQFHDVLQYVNLFCLLKSVNIPHTRLLEYSYS